MCRSHVPIIESHLADSAAIAPLAPVGIHNLARRCIVADMARALFAFLTLLWLLVPLGQAGDDSEAPNLLRLNVVATNLNGDPVTDLRVEDLKLKEDGKVRPIVFFRFAAGKRSFAGTSSGWFANRPVPVTRVILLDRWNEQMIAAKGAWLDMDAALTHLETTTSVYVYLITNHGVLYPVYPLPTTEGDVITAALPTPGQLRGMADAAITKFRVIRIRMSRIPFCVLRGRCKP